MPPFSWRRAVSIRIEIKRANRKSEIGSLHTEGLQKAVKRHGADIGIAHDGDADRAIFCDERGEILDGDQVMGMWAVEMKKEKMLKKILLSQP